MSCVLLVGSLLSDPPSGDGELLAFVIGIGIGSPCARLFPPVGVRQLQSILISLIRIISS